MAATSGEPSSAKGTVLRVWAATWEAESREGRGDSGAPGSAGGGEVVKIRKRMINALPSPFSPTNSKDLNLSELPNAVSRGRLLRAPSEERARRGQTVPALAGCGCGALFGSRPPTPSSPPTPARPRIPDVATRRADPGGRPLAPSARRPFCRARTRFPPRSRAARDTHCRRCSPSCR